MSPNPSQNLCLKKQDRQFEPHANQVTALLGGFVSANLYQKLGGEKWAWYPWHSWWIIFGVGLVVEEFAMFMSMVFLGEF